MEFYSITVLCCAEYCIGDLEHYCLYSIEYCSGVLEHYFVLHSVEYWSIIVLYSVEYWSGVLEHYCIL